jgi:hypothetical protein
MPRLNVLQNQYLIASMGIGLALILIISLTFLMMKKSRGTILHSEENPSPPKESLESIPWVLFLTIGGALLFGLLVTIYRTFNPPNW